MDRSQRPSLSLRQLRKDWPLVLLIAALFAVAAYFYPQLPEKVPSHWGVGGEIDRYSSRFFGAFGLPLLASGIYVLMLVVPGMDPKKAAYEHFAGAYDVIRWALVSFIALLHAVILMAGLGYSINAGLIVQPAVSVLFVVIGQQLGKVKHNYTVGIRTPWTLASQEVWQKTHRFAAPLWVAAGLVGLLATWLPGPYNFWVFIIAIAGAAVISGGYSYFAFKALSGS